MAEKEVLGGPNTQPVEWVPPEPTIMQMLDRAVQSGQPIDYLKELIALKGLLDQQALDAEERVARKAYDTAMTAAKHQLPTSIKRSGLASFETQRGGTSYTYASLDDILEETVPTLAANGLRHRFDVKQNQETVAVTCIMRHADGHYEDVTMSGPFDKSGSKNTIQALGSTTTYLKKYTFLALLGIAAGEDDDAKLSVARPPQAGPDAMKGQTHPNAPPPEQATEKAPPVSEEEKTRIVEQARLAAKQGEDVFRGFYVNLKGPQRQALFGLHEELRALMNKADAQAQN